MIKKFRNHFVITNSLTYRWRWCLRICLAICVYNFLYVKRIMKVGPKGQVVIPEVFRDALKIYPRTEVTFRIEHGKLVIEKPRRDAVQIFRRIAVSGKKFKRKLQPHEAYEGALKDQIK